MSGEPFNQCDLLNQMRINDSGQVRRASGRPVCLVLQGRHRRIAPRRAALTTWREYLAEQANYRHRTDNAPAANVGGMARLSPQYAREREAFPSHGCDKLACMSAIRGAWTCAPMNFGASCRTQGR